MNTGKNSLLVCQDLIKVFENPFTKESVHALRGCDFYLREKEFVTIVGPSGSGKTTLLRIISGLERPTGGMIRLGNLDYTKLSPFHFSLLRQHKIGLVEQFVDQNLLPSLSVFENLLLTARQRGFSRKDARRAAEQLLKEWSLHHLRDRKAGRISGGEGQRASVLATLIKKPLMILADEPTGQLDADNSEIVQEALQSAIKDIGSSVIVVTHDQSFEKKANRTFRIENGRLSSIIEKETDAEPGFPDLLTEDVMIKPKEPKTTSTIEVDASEPGREEHFEAYVDQFHHVKLPQPIVERLKIRQTIEFHIDSSNRVWLLNPQKEADDRKELPAPISFEHAVETLWENLPPETELRKTLAGPAILCEDVCKAYAENSQKQSVFDDFSCEISSGEFIAITGVSGVGKSTLLNMIPGLIKSDSGDIMILDTSLTDLSSKELSFFRRNYIGVVRQNKGLFPGMTPYENLALILSTQESDAKAQEAWLQALLDACQISHRAHSPVEALSGGERQRAAIACALVKAPPILALDEPTANVDSEIAQNIMELLLAIHRRLQPTVVLATHDLSLVQPPMREIRLQKPG
ncbi:MAG: ATP-binding cassette domain-containing protein [Candidatus Hodarchaeales archaeon]|jgi:ABC-type lipoprotein export system ATPase subunit